MYRTKVDYYLINAIIIGLRSTEYSPGSVWSSSHWRSAYKFEIIGGDPSIYSDLVFFIAIFQHPSVSIILSSVAEMQFKKFDMLFRLVVGLTSS